MQLNSIIMIKDSFVKNQRGGGINEGEMRMLNTLKLTTPSAYFY